jgi:hypothetical protein
MSQTQEFIEKAKIIAYMGEQFLEKIEEMKALTKNNQDLIPELKKHPDFEGVNKRHLDIINRLNNHFK